MPTPTTQPEKIECPTCRGQGAIISSETNDQYDRTFIQWTDCRTCGGEGSVEVEERDDEQ